MRHCRSLLNYYFVKIYLAEIADALSRALSSYHCHYCVVVVAVGFNVIDSDF